MNENTEDPFQRFIDNNLLPKHRGFPDKEEELRLVMLAKGGDRRAEAALVCAHYRMILKVALWYSKTEVGYSTDDLFQEGFKGFRRAIYKYDPKYGTRFLGYALRWVRQFMQRYSGEQRRVVRIPSHVNEKLSKMRRLSGQALTKRGYRLSQKELLKAADVTPESKMGKAILSAYFGEEMPLSEEIAATTEDPSLESLPKSFAPYDDSKQFEFCASHELSEFVRAALLKLSSIHAEVLRCRFFEEQKLEPIAAILVKRGLMKRVVSAERIRTIEKEALLKLKQLISKMSQYREMQENMNS